MIEQCFELQQRQDMAKILTGQEALREDVRALNSSLNKPDPRRYVYGIQGLANLLCCSRPTAQRIKSSGVIDGAISQYKRTIAVDADEAMRLLRTSRQNRI